MKKIAGGISQDRKPPERSRLIAEVLNQLEPVMEQLDAEDWLEEYRRRSVVIGKEVSVIKDSGVTDTEPRFFLLMRKQDWLSV